MPSATRMAAATLRPQMTAATEHGQEVETTGIQLGRIPSKENEADIGTKYLEWENISKCLQKMAMSVTGASAGSALHGCGVHVGFEHQEGNVVFLTTLEKMLLVTTMILLATTIYFYKKSKQVQTVPQIEPEGEPFPARPVLPEEADRREEPFVYQAALDEDLAPEDQARTEQAGREAAALAAQGDFQRLVVGGRLETGVASGPSISLVLREYNVAQLREVCKRFGSRGHSNFRRGELVERIDQWLTSTPYGMTERQCNYLLDLRRRQGLPIWTVGQDDVFFIHRRAMSEEIDRLKYNLPREREGPWRG